MMWFLGWTQFALSHQYNPLFSDFLDYPHGVNLMWNTSVLLPGALLAPVTTWQGPVVAYNLLITLSLPLSAWCAYLAIGRWVQSRVAAVVGGLLYGFSPYMMAQALAHPQMSLAFAPPLVLLLLENLLAQHGGATPTGLALGTLAAVQLLTGEELLATSALIALLGVLLLLVLRRDRVDAHQVRHVGHGLGVAAATFLLLGAVPLTTQFLGPQQVSGAVHPHSFFATDLLNLVVPSRVQLVAPPAALHVSHHFWANVYEQNAYLGLPLLALLVSIAVRWWAHLVVRWASLLATLTVVLSLGAHLMVGGHILPVTLPWHVVEHLPLLENILPARLMLYVYLLAGVLLAFYLDQRRQPRARRLGAYTLVALALVPLIPQPTHPITSDVVPAFFSGDGVRRIPDGSVALIAPFVPYYNPYHDGPYSRAMLWQSMARMRFRMPEGYAFVPHSSAGTQSSPPASALQTVLRAVQAGQAAPALTSRLRHQLLDELSAWHVRTVIIGPMGNRTAMRLFFTRLLDRPPVRSGGVDVWWHAQTLPLYGGKPAAMIWMPSQRQVLCGILAPGAAGPRGRRCGCPAVPALLCGMTTERSWPSARCCGSSARARPITDLRHGI
jgi:hypothetical protein